VKIPKRELKYQRDLYNKILTGTTESITPELVDKIYEELNPAICNNISEGGVYWTPYGLAQDLAVFSPRYGHILDLCSGIGMLSYRVKDMDSYNKDIISMTCIEYDKHFVELGKKLLPSANWINGNAYDKTLLDDLVKDLPDQRFDLVISNPPFGVDMNKGDYSWLNYQGHRDLMALEIALKYGKNAMFILPSGSVPFRYSGAQYYDDSVDRYSQKLKKFFKENKDIHFTMQCDGIDTSIYKDEWQNLPGGIGCEVVNVSLYPFSLWDKEDSITLRLK
jgi:predicted RNA methylase